ncbi:MAG: peptidylprolyl isomerase [Candidatus Brocadiia bacterium]
MKYSLFAVTLCFVCFAVSVFAEDPVTPPVSQSPTIVAPTPTPTPTPTPKPALETGQDVDGLHLAMVGKLNFKKVEAGVEPVNVGFKLELNGEKAEVVLNSNAFKCFSVEMIDEDKRASILRTGAAFPQDGTEFKLPMISGSYYGGTLTNLEKYFDFGDGGVFYVRAIYKLADNKVVRSDWATVNVYSRVCVRVETREGSFLIWLRMDDAPQTCKNFLTLVEKGYYNNQIFHRVENRPIFKLIQGGDPHGDGSGGPGYTIPFEESKLKHEEGAVGMGLTGQDKNSAGSQFYICVEPIPSLDGRYVVFAKVTEGLDTCKKIAATQTRPDAPNKPRNPVEMIKLSVEYLK